SGGLPSEDPDRREDQRLEQGPADDREDRSDIERRRTGVEGVAPEDSLERADEDLARVEDELDQVVALAGVEQQEHDPQQDHDLDQPEEENDEAAGDRAATRTTLDRPAGDRGAAVIAWVDWICHL